MIGKSEVLVVALMILIGGFARGAAPEVEFSFVDGSDAQPGGPSHDFRIARFEIRNDQFVEFLNDALANLDNERGAYLFFDTDTGAVFVHTDETGDSGIDGSGTLVFDLSLNDAVTLNGTVYEVDAASENHPVTGVTWFGALKYCNWLTLSTGLSPDDRAYAEAVDSELDGWRPVSITNEDWATRDLNDTERAALLEVLGYRLPMDGGDGGGSPSAYNEWYKAAAWDETAGADHVYGFGRDVIVGADANYRCSGDPFEDPFDCILGGTSPVGFYDGTDHGGVYPTNADTNAYGLFDISGNVWEWMQDQGFDGGDRRNRGGSFRSSSGTVQVSVTAERTATTSSDATGFRVVQSSALPLLVTPFGTLDITGFWGGPFDVTPPEIEYSVRNLTNTDVSLAVSVDVDWVDVLVTPIDGVVPAGASIDVLVAVVSDCLDSLELGVNEAIVTFTFNGTETITERTVVVAVDEPLGVTPLDGLQSIMVVGGLPDPPNAVFTIESMSDQDITWSALWEDTSTPANAAAWLLLDGGDTTGGVVLGGGAFPIVVAIDAAVVAAFDAGEYTADVTFANECTGEEFVRTVSLSVSVPFDVSPVDLVESSGPVDGPFDPPSHTFTLTNSSTDAVDWSATLCEVVEGSGDCTPPLLNWLELDQTQGTLSPAGEVLVVATILDTVPPLDAETYELIIRFEAPASGFSVDRTVSLEVTGLRVEPVADAAFEGHLGGPFTPAAKTYELFNETEFEMEWDVSIVQDPLPAPLDTVTWVQALPMMGVVLDPQDSVTIAVSIAPDAVLLPEGNYAAVVTFTGGDATATRDVSLVVGSEGFSLSMSMVPGADEQFGGPTHDFRIGRFEVSNAEYARFLNDAWRNKSDPRGQFLYHDTDSGSVYINDAVDGADGTAAPAAALVTQLYNASAGRIEFDVNSDDPYIVESGFESHPAVGVSWYGAAKFCNWLTLVQGMPSTARAYVEGTAAEQWGAVSSDPAVVIALPGFRLPLDDFSGGTSTYNEWYKAASRMGVNGDGDAVFGGVYGFGRNALTNADANYLASGDTEAEGTTSVGFFNGVNELQDETVTTDTENEYDLFDLCGNAAEWVHETDAGGVAVIGVVRGGHFNLPAGQDALRTDVRSEVPADSAFGFLGFRVVQSVSDVALGTSVVAGMDRAEGPVGGAHVGSSFVVQLSNDEAFTKDDVVFSLSSESGWLEFDGLPPRQVAPGVTLDVPLQLSELVDGLTVSPAPSIVDMTLVPKREQQLDGPDYDFWVGTAEVTNTQFATFLNDVYAGAILEEPDSRSDFLFFDIDSGDVYVNDAEPAGVGPNAPSGTISLLMYDASIGRVAFVDDSYVVQGGFENHPVVGVTWYGAVKYCNWLTVESGLVEDMRAYAEGTDAGDWRPETIADSDWSTRDMNDAERLRLIRSRIGFRLPMDDGAGNADPAADAADGYNEWFKASARRVDVAGLPGFDAVYGFGRDVLTAADANYFDSGDTDSNGTTPRDFFDGVNMLADGETSTTETENGYELVNVAGNVAEWMQDCFADGAGCDRAVRGGSWRDTDPASLAVATRSAQPPDVATDYTGFRVVRGTGYVGTVTIEDRIADATTTHYVVLDLTEPFEVLPLDDLVPVPTAICGDASGDSKTYTISNVSAEEMPWEVSTDQPWVTITGPEFGELSGDVPAIDGALPGQVLIEVATNAQTNDLPPGDHVATITILNTRTDQQFEREVRLSLLHMLELQTPVGDGEDIEFEELWEGAFDELPEVAVSLSRCMEPGCELACSLDYEVTIEYDDAQAIDWLIVGPEELLQGGLPGVGETVDLQLSIDAVANTFTPGDYTARLIIALIDPDDGLLSNPIERTITLAVTDPIALTLQAEFVDGVWDVGCELDLDSIPPRIYQLLNQRLTDEIGVLVSADVAWVDITPSSLSLLPGADADVQVALNDAAPQTPGDYTVSITFRDTLTGFDQVREVVVEIQDDFCVAPLTGLEAFGQPGGTVSPSAVLYTVSNAAEPADGDVSWSVSSDQPWILFAGQTTGTLGDGQEALVTVTIDETALPALPPGDTEATFEAFITFTTQPSGSAATRPVRLALVQPGFSVDESAVAVEPMQPAGPTYPFQISRFHVTGAEFVAFLNDALARPDHERGQHMFFETTTGDVYVHSAITGSFGPSAGNLSVLMFSPAVAGQVEYVDGGSPPYRVVDTPIDFADHPVTGVSWYGAVKYCNWLTLDQGMSATQRCYAEGTDADLTEWRPVVISVADWALRDLQDAERALLVSQYRGYRLPMDDGPGNPDPSTDAADLYNEWFKAASWNSDLGTTLYGFGVDPAPITGSHANYRCSDDPFEDPGDCQIGGTSPVGFYDGVNVLADGSTLTIASQNVFDLFDMSGNAFQWVQGRYNDDTNGIGARTVRGGSYQSPAVAIESRSRNWGPPGLTHPEIGFRVLRTVASATGDANQDGVVDLGDMSVLAAGCLTGPGSGLAAGCAVFDLESDTDVDLRDVRLLLNLFDPLP